MVTTFSPPARAKKKAKVNLPVLPIALGVVIVALLAGLVMTNGKLTKANETATELTDAVVATAKAAGLETVTPEALADLTNGPIVLASVTTAVSDRVNELQAARAEVEQAKTNVGRLETEGQTAQEQLAALRGQVDTARGEAKAKADEVAALQKSTAEQIAGLNASIDELKGQLETALASAASAPEMAEETVAETVVDTSVETVVVAEVPTESAVAEPAVDAVAEPKAKVGNQASIIPEGKSALFKTVRYNAKKSQLVFLTLDEQVITYSDVPENVIEELLAAPILDLYYRFKVMDVYVSEPKDREVIRSVGN
jgi:predicted  nucleic acid-binding Zn-ribbon protein